MILPLSTPLRCSITTSESDQKLTKTTEIVFSHPADMIWTKSYRNLLFSRSGTACRKCEIPCSKNGGSKKNTVIYNPKNFPPAAGNNYIMLCNPFFVYVRQNSLPVTFIIKILDTTRVTIPNLASNNSLRSIIFDNVRNTVHDWWNQNNNSFLLYNFESVLQQT